MPPGRRTSIAGGWPENNEPGQNCTRKPSWMLRGPMFVVPVTLPKSPEEMSVLARPNCGVFVRLNISARNCAFHRSPYRKFLRMATSACLVGPKRMVGTHRVALPISYVPGRVNADVLNQ